MSSSTSASILQNCSSTSTPVIVSNPVTPSDSTTPSPRPRMGGTTMKTAKVWRYFDQLPTEEQAAECKICLKKIKATNSSTTGMIRHLRSCHVSEYQVLQEARQNGLIVKQEEKARALLMKQSGQTEKQKHKMKDMANLTSTNLLVPTASNETNEMCKLNTNSKSSSLKKRKVDESEVVDLRVNQNVKEDTSPNNNEQNRKVKENFWPDDHPEARRITNQIGLMLLLDNDNPATVEKIGFRGLLRLLEPKYRTPSADRFRETILPEIFNQLKSDVYGFQHCFLYNNRFGMSPLSESSTNLPITSNTSESVTLDRHTPSNTSTVQPQDTYDLNRVVINSIRSAQNISQSFSHSIQLKDEDSDSSTDSSTRLAPPVASFLQLIGKYVLHPDQVVGLISRCHLVFRFFDESREDCFATRTLNLVRSTNAVTDLARCVDFVEKNLASITAFHTRCPIPGFSPFSETETHFLTDLNAHLHTL